MPDSGRLSTSDAPLTKQRLLENHEKLRRTIDYLVGRVDWIEPDKNSDG